jgi:hypothetical protein
MKPYLQTAFNLAPELLIFLDMAAAGLTKKVGTKFSRVDALRLIISKEIKSASETEIDIYLTKLINQQGESF